MLWAPGHQPLTVRLYVLPIVLSDMDQQSYLSWQSCASRGKRTLSEASTVLSSDSMRPGVTGNFRVGSAAVFTPGMTGSSNMIGPCPGLLIPPHAIAHD